MKLFGIGYLMDELKIKTSELANYIYVDRSLISRWKSNTRNLDPNADYFDKILEFFILKNKETSNNILEKMFSLDTPAEETKIKSLLREFIVNKETPSIYNKFIKKIRTSHT
ncbi:MAG: helix-turn-helix transcriptional regulator [Clostridium sp.]|nr:helix-turn-helix transcriptional regulator [Clostridium sp.]MDU7084351.1 helix-turn-helix transcriptional regulator [Clostridium sp.]